jgi:hypothetical protein
VACGIDGCLIRIVVIGSGDNPYPTDAFIDIIEAAGGEFRQLTLEVIDHRVITTFSAAPQ